MPYKPELTGEQEAVQKDSNDLLTKTANTETV